MLKLLFLNWEVNHGLWKYSQTCNILHKNILNQFKNEVRGYLFFLLDEYFLKNPMDPEPIEGKQQSLQLIF